LSFFKQPKTLRQLQLIITLVIPTKEESQTVAVEELYHIGLTHEAESEMPRTSA